jgi:SAM-dependent methyltransferase
MVMELMADDYFVRRKSHARNDCQRDYWSGGVRDPDGILRNKLEERELYLSDIKMEVAFLENLKPGRILDIGCGPGFLLSALNRKWDKFGCEISPIAAEVAKKHATVENSDFKKTCYPDKFFDVIVMHHVIEHLKDPLWAIRKVYRLLKGQGTLLIATPDFDSGCARLFGENYRLLHDPTHINLFSNDSMRRFLRDHGFIIDGVDYPFFETRHFTMENLERLFDTTKISPPFYGNFMTFYCHKPLD